MSERVLQILIQAFPKILIPCIKVTIPLTICSFILGLILALFLAIVQIANIRGLKQCARFYIWIFRGTPLLVQLFIVFFGLPSLGIMLDAFPSAVIAFSLNLAAYNAEVIRSAILAVPAGQTEAALMVGLSYPQLMAKIVLPQAGRIAFPPLFNSLIGLTKDTSLASSITLIEMFSVAQQVAARYYEPFALYCEAAVIYLLNVTCSGVILAVSPIVSTAFAALFLKELPTKRQAVFSVVAVTGVIMITVAEGIAGEIQPVGIVLLIGGCICSALFRVINRSIVKIYTAFERTYVVLLVSAAAFTIAGIVDIRGNLFTLVKPLSMPQFWLPVLALGLFSSVGANMMMNYAAAKMPVVQISVFGAVCTICSMAGGILFLHEPITPMTIIGAFLILFGIWQVNKATE